MNYEYIAENGNSYYVHRNSNPIISHVLNNNSNITPLNLTSDNSHVTGIILENRFYSILDNITLNNVHPVLNESELSQQPQQSELSHQPLVLSTNNRSRSQVTATRPSNAASCRNDFFSSMQSFFQRCVKNLFTLKSSKNLIQKLLCSNVETDTSTNVNNSTSSSTPINFIERNFISLSKYFPTESYIPRSNPTSDDVCSICQLNFVVSDILKRLPCFHRFHSSCIDVWIDVNVTCPVCRFPVINGVTENNQSLMEVISNNVSSEFSDNFSEINIQNSVSRSYNNHGNTNSLSLMMGSRGDSLTYFNGYYMYIPNISITYPNSTQIENIENTERIHTRNRNSPTPDSTGNQLNFKTQHIHSSEKLSKMTEKLKTNTNNDHSHNTQNGNTHISDANVTSNYSSNNQHEEGCVKVPIQNQSCTIKQHIPKESNTHLSQMKSNVSNSSCPKDAMHSKNLSGEKTSENTKTSNLYRTKSLNKLPTNSNKVQNNKSCIRHITELSPKHSDMHTRPNFDLMIENPNDNELQSEPLLETEVKHTGIRIKGNTEKQDISNQGINVTIITNIVQNIIENELQQHTVSNTKQSTGYIPNIITTDNKHVDTLGLQSIKHKDELQDVNLNLKSNTDSLQNRKHRHKYNVSSLHNISSKSKTPSNSVGDKIKLSKKKKESSFLIDANADSTNSSHSSTPSLSNTLCFHPSTQNNLDIQYFPLKLSLKSSDSCIQ